MAYNLRTGLIGSGDIDINVSLNDLNAANITTGVFSAGVIPTLGDAKISDLDAAKLTGTLNVARIADGSITKSKIGENMVPWAETEIPVLPKSKVDPTHSTQWHVDDIPNLDASKITTGTVASARLALTSGDIPSLDASKITTGTVASARLALTSSDIPSLDATKITTGSFASADRIPLLPTSKIDSSTTFAKSMINSEGAWAVGDIPNLPTTKLDAATSDLDLNGNDLIDVNELKFIAQSGNKITGNGTYKTEVTNCDLSSSTNVMPSTHDVLDYNAMNGDYYVLSVGSSYTTIHSSLRSNNVASVPASCAIEVELSFYYNGLSYDILSRLVVGGTNDEFVDDVIDDTSLSRTTDDTVAATSSTSEGYATVKWTLKFASSQAGDQINIEPQVKTNYPGATFGVRSGENTSSGACFPSMVFKITALPSASTITMYSNGH